MYAYGLEYEEEEYGIEEMVNFLAKAKSLRYLDISYNGLLDQVRYLDSHTFEAFIHMGIVENIDIQGNFYMIPRIAA